MNPDGDGASLKADLLPVPLSVNESHLGEVRVRFDPWRNRCHEMSQIHVQELDCAGMTGSWLNQKTKARVPGLLDSQQLVRVVPEEAAAVLGILGIIRIAEGYELDGLVWRVIVSKLEPGGSAENC